MTNLITKTWLLHLLILSVLIISITSCSVSKHRYSSGYTIEIREKNKLLTALKERKKYIQKETTSSHLKLPSNIQAFDSKTLEKATFLPLTGYKTSVIENKHKKQFEHLQYNTRLAPMDTNVVKVKKDSINNGFQIPVPSQQNDSLNIGGFFLFLGIIAGLILGIRWLINNPENWFEIT